MGNRVISAVTFSVVLDACLSYELAEQKSQGDCSYKYFMQQQATLLCL